MENVSNALLMAGGILLGVLILTLMATLFLSSRDVSISYNERIKSESVQQFNVNFTQYLGQDLSMHQLLTIANFASIENNKIANVTIKKDTTIIDLNKEQLQRDIQEAINKSSQNLKVEVVYTMNITKYDDETGYVSEIKFSNRRYKETVL